MFWLQLFLLHNLATTIFRTIGALCRNLVVANAMVRLPPCTVCAAPHVVLHVPIG